MVWIPGGTFRMGSDRHYPEEAPVHRVSIDGFWLDRTPVTNRQFKEFVRSTGHKTFAQIPASRHSTPSATCLSDSTPRPKSAASYNSAGSCRATSSICLPSTAA
jgi:formylglycine-generating enzyme required for sulfatase activity